MKIPSPYSLIHARRALASAAALTMALALPAPAEEAPAGGQPAATGAGQDSAPDGGARTEALEQEVADLWDRLHAATQDASRLREERDQLAARQQAAATAAAQLEAQRQALEDEASRLRRELADASTARDRINARLQEAARSNESLNNRVEELERETARLSASLAEAQTAVTSRSAEIVDLRDRMERLEAMLAEARSEVEAARGRAAEAEDTAGRLARERDAVAADLSLREEDLESLRAEAQALEERASSTARARDALEQEVAEVRDSLTATRDDNVALRTRIDAMRQERDRLADVGEELTGRVDTLGKQLLATETGLADARLQARDQAARLAKLESRLPPAEGGTASITAAEAAASRAAEQFREAQQAHRRAPSSADLRAARALARDALQAEQLLVARLTDALGTYQVRAEDSLARVAARFYGNGNRWPEIYRANDHILDDPDRLYAGMTLVVP